jgi:uncharacterized membrane protein YcaP (DUF421 family)
VIKIFEYILKYIYIIALILLVLAFIKKKLPEIDWIYHPTNLVENGFINFVPQTFKKSS